MRFRLAHRHNPPVATFVVACAPGSVERSHFPSRSDIVFFLWLVSVRSQERLAADTAREATSDEVKVIQAQARQLKELLAELLLENRLLKKSVLGDGGTDT